MTFHVYPGVMLGFAFTSTDVTFSRDEQNLVCTFDDGAQVTLEGFYNNFDTAAQQPTFIVDGRKLPAEDFLAGLNAPDLMPGFHLRGYGCEE